MDKYTKFLALMSFALVMSACQDDNIISVAPALPGDDIVFGATGYLESGDKGTRTIYGDVYEDLYGKHIQVKWVNNGKKEKKQWQSPVLFFDCLSERRLATNNDS